MQKVGQDFFSGPVFPLNKNRNVRTGHLLDFISDRLHGERLPENNIFGRQVPHSRGQTGAVVHLSLSSWQ